MKILALDTARRTGWAIGAPNQRVRFGHVTFPDAGIDDVGWIMDEFIRWLDPLIKLERPDAIVYEAPFVSGQTNQAAAYILLSLAGCVELVARWNGLAGDLWKATPHQRNIHFIGTNSIGREKLKLATIAKCRELGADVRNDDEADACSLLSYAWADIQVAGAEPLQWKE